MKRRNFILGTSAVAGGGAIVGSSAFTSVTADRDIQVAVAGDSNAFLRIEPTAEPNGDYATTENGTLGIDLTGDNDAVGGDGVNANAVSVLRRVFEIGNQGTQSVGVQITEPVLTPEDGLAVGVFPEGQDPTEPFELSPGGTQQVFSLVVASDDSINKSPQLPEETFEVIADAEAI